MTVRQYCTPEWLADSADGYPKNPRFQAEFKKLSLKLCFQVNAEPEWGIEKDIYFRAHVDKGELLKLSFIGEAEAFQDSDFILSATPQEWKKILRKESKFVTDFILGKIVLEQGNKVGVLGIAPHSNTFVDTLTQFELQFPDEMTPDELERYRTYQREFRKELGV